MKVLIFGGTGLVGKELVKAFEGEHEVLAPTSKQLDVKATTWVNDYIFQTKPDVVINAVAKANVDGCEEDAFETMDVNALFPGELARMAAGHGFKLVHISSDYVFSGADKSWYMEMDKPNPVSVYGLSKLEGERRVDFCKTHMRARTLIVRTSWVFGRGRETFVEYFLKKLAEATEDKVKIVSDQIGTPTLAKDLAVAIRRLVEVDASGVVHFANSGDTSKYQMMNEAVMQANRMLAVDLFRASKLQPISFTELNWKAKRPQYSPLHTNLFQQLTGERPRHWQEALVDHLKDIEPMMKGMVANEGYKI